MILNRRAAFALVTLFIVSGETTAPSVSATEATTRGPQKSRDLQSLCTPEVMRRYAPRGVVIKTIPNYSAAPQRETASVNATLCSHFYFRPSGGRDTGVCRPSATIVHLYYVLNVKSAVRRPSLSCTPDTRVNPGVAAHPCYDIMAKLVRSARFSCPDCARITLGNPVAQNQSADVPGGSESLILLTRDKSFWGLRRRF
jgi:hypothetical protein